MKTTIIPAGYRLTVSSCEDDGDAAVTKVLEGLSREKLLAYLAIALAFRDSDMANCYEDDDGSVTEQLAAFGRKLFAEHHGVLWVHEHPILEDGGGDDIIIDRLRDLMSNIGLCSVAEFYTRYTDNITVQHVPADIMLHDVTEEFDV